mmetsp:Transcript_24579/g.85451  ORF Transcript_24579/g.85451 Transcript_24579/m.85451 type:complete len:355 (-) Transcript_24579:1210-2274(-)
MIRAALSRAHGAGSAPRARWAVTAAIDGRRRCGACVERARATPRRHAGSASRGDGTGAADARQAWWLGDDAPPIVTHAPEVNEIGFVTDLELFKPYDVTVPVYREWQAWLDGRNAAAPAGVARALQVAGVSWTWVFSERAMVTNAVQGVIVALVAAWIVLIASTRNVVVGSLASVSIIGIVACVLGLVGALKWEMGTTESISCVIVVGMSVDYVVHIASSYVESEAKTRRKRITRALEEMGISVVAGAMTTLGAGLFLAPAVLIFFKKFAVLIAATIIFSLLWSLVMFPSLLLVWGPEGDYGSFRAIAAGARRWCGRGRGSGEGEGQDAGKDDGDVELTTAVADAAETPVATLG